MARPFSTYNMKSHNQALGVLRTEAARRRNNKALEALRAGRLPAQVAIDFRIPRSVLPKLVKLAKEVAI